MSDEQRRQKQQERLHQAEQFIDALRSEEVDAVVGKEHVLLLRLRELEEALRRSEARYRGIVETQTELICCRKPDSTISFVNNAYCRFFGKTAEELVGKIFDPPVYEKDLPSVDRAMKELDRSNPVMKIECRMKTGEDSLCWCRWIVQALYDEKGALGEIQVIGRDISDQKRAEKKLQETMEQLRSVLDNSRDGIHRLDLNSQRYVFMNRAQERLTGFDMAELIGLTLEKAADRLHPSDVPVVESYLNGVIAGGEPEEPMEYRWRVKSGEYRWFSDSRRAIRDGAKNVVSIIGISRDITEKKAAEKALRSAHLELESRNQDLNNAYKELYEYSEAISQDLNGIIRAVSNYTDFLYEDLSQSLTGEQRLYLENLKQVAKEGALLIKDLRTLAKIGKYPDEPAPVDFDGIVKETAAVLKLTPERVGLDLPDTWPAIEAPPGLIRIILNNLFSNAVKFNQSEKPRVEMGWREHTPGRIEIYVRDNGIGIDPLYHARIFQVFKRLHTRKEYEGIGSGLAIVRKAVSKMGGSVRLESTPGHGSTFFVDLPLSTT